MEGQKAEEKPKESKQPLKGKRPHVDETQDKNDPHWKKKLLQHISVVLDSLPVTFELSRLNFS